MENFTSLEMRTIPATVKTNCAVNGIMSLKNYVAQREDRQTDRDYKENMLLLIQCITFRRIVEDQVTFGSVPTTNLRNVECSD
jgi:hypothetical protein